MPEENVKKRAQAKKRQGKSASTQAGEYVHEEMRHKEQGKHSAHNPKQAIAIGLSKARREGVDLKPPKKGKTSAATRKKAQQDYSKGHAKAAGSKKAKKKTTTKRAAAKKTTRKGAAKKKAASRSSSR